ncbi:MAG: ribokinase [Bacteroidaceae bacterium]|nr:ribokinase [Bacteroidaceae bacterium]
MERRKLCCIGFITRDTIITPDNLVDMPGGTAWYFAKAIAHLSTKDFHLVTAIEESQTPVVEDLRSNGINVTALPTRQAVHFENIYGTDFNNRTQRVKAIPDPFTVNSLQDIEADVIHLGTLLHDDFPLDVIRYLSTKSRLSVDVQGFLRQVLPNGQVQHTDWAEKLQALPYIYTLKANEIEMQVLTGASDPYEAALILKDMGVQEVILTLGDQGSLIYTRGAFHEIPAYPTLNVIDATGCGDTYMAGYLYERQRGATIDNAAKFAAAMCTLKLQNHGPFCSNELVVRKISANSSFSL